MTQPAAVWMVRHAPVRATRLCYGQSNVATRVDANRAADSIEAEFRKRGAGPWDELWCSPWERTERVAAVLAARSGVPCRSDARLSELSFGAWEGIPYGEIEAHDRERFAEWVRAYDTVAPPGGETADQLRTRVADFLSEIDGSGKTVLIVAHAGTIRAARAVRAGLPYSGVVHTRVEFLVPEKI
jgi:alpha-ribazole phosphatase